MMSPSQLTYLEDPNFELAFKIQTEIQETKGLAFG